MKVVKLSDGKGIGEQHRLSGSEKVKLQDHCGKVIRSNTGDLEEIRRAVLATYCHRLSTDKTPQH
jgi:hypothetical protein